MTTSKTRFWVLGGAVVGVLIIVAAYFLAIGPKRAEAKDLREQTVGVQTANSMLEARIEQLKVQFAELPLRQAELAAIQQAMPEDAALPTLVRELDRRATAAGVTLMSITPGEPAEVAPETPAPVAEAEGEDPEAAAAPAPSRDLLASIPVQISVVGGFFESELFLKSLQVDMPRALLVQSLSVTAEEEADAGSGKPATRNGDVTLVVSGSVFVLKPGGPAAEPAPQATSADGTQTT